MSYVDFLCKRGMSCALVTALRFASVAGEVAPVLGAHGHDGVREGYRSLRIWVNILF